MLSIPEGSSVKNSTPLKGASTTIEEEKLFLHLKNLRKSIADRDNLPPYVIFHDKSLRDMARILPCDQQSFGNIVGVGEFKLEKYGPVFTSAIKNYCEECEKETTPAEKIGDPESETALERIYQFEQDITSLNEKLKELTALRSALVNQVVESKIRQQGKYILQSSTASVRQLNLEAFKQRYPQIFMEIATVRLKDADTAIGRTEVTSLCTLKESTTYRVVDTESEKE